MKVRTPEELIKTNLIVRHKAGSHAYGTNIETSDLDIRGIFVADSVNIRTPFFPIEEKDVGEEEDTKFYELANYMKLCLQCNVNIIETLWVDKADIEFSTPAYEILRDYRSFFLSSKIAFTTSGYAISQLKRIKGHNKWISQPQPEKSPVPAQFITMIQWYDSNVKMMPRDFDIYNFNVDYRLIPYGNEIFGVYKTPGHNSISDNGSLNVAIDEEVVREQLGIPLAIVKWNRTEYTTAKEKHAQYWNWKKNRNVVRSQLEEGFGYDTKHAMHLVRLLRMGKEILTTGEVLVKRPDAQELLAIRNGAWDYDDLVKYAEDMDKEIQEVLYPKTHLRKFPNIHLAAEVLMEVQDSIWSK